MCSVSAIVSEWTNPLSPNYFQPYDQLEVYRRGITAPTIQPDTATLMLQIIAKLEELDRKVNAIDCKLAEPEKEAFKKMLRIISGEEKTQ